MIIQDPTLLHQVDVFYGVKPDGYILINSNHSIAGLGLDAADIPLAADHFRYFAAAGSMLEG